MPDKNDEDNKNKQLFEEYKLAIETQMHFNDLLMKLRTFGLTAVAAIFSYAITRGQQLRLIMIFGLALLVSIFNIFACDKGLLRIFP